MHSCGGRDEGGGEWEGAKCSLDLQCPAFSFDRREALVFTRCCWNNRGRILRCDLLFISQLCSSSAPISVCSQNGAGEQAFDPSFLYHSWGINQLVLGSAGSAWHYWIVQKWTTSGANVLRRLNFPHTFSASGCSIRRLLASVERFLRVQVRANHFIHDLLVVPFIHYQLFISTWLHSPGLAKKILTRWSPIYADQK